MEAIEINDGGHLTSDSTGNRETQEAYPVGPLAALFDLRIGISGAKPCEPYYSYPRLSGTATAYCIFNRYPLRLDVFGSTYVLHDSTIHEDIHLRFPERTTGNVKTDTIGDGSFPCEAWKLNDAAAPYLIFWLYPHLPRVHVWAVHEDGRRRNGFDLPTASAERFLSFRARLNVMFHYRLLLLQAQHGAQQIGKLGESKHELPQHQHRRAANFEFLASCNIDEWGELLAYLRLLQRAALLTPTGQRILEGTIRHLGDAYEDRVGLPGVLAEVKRLSLAQALGHDTGADIGLDHGARVRERLHQIVDLLGRGQSVAALLTREVRRQIPNDRVNWILRTSNSTFVRVMTPDEQDSAERLSHDLFLCRISTGVPFAIEIALPRFFSTVEALANYVDRWDGMNTLSRIFLLAILVVDMLALGISRLRAMLVSDLGCVPTALEFYVSWHDVCVKENIVTLGRRVGNNNPLIPDLYFYRSNGYEHCKEVAWLGRSPVSERKQVVIWRGGTSGAKINEQNIRVNPRINLAFFCKQYPEIFDVKITDVTQLDRESASRVQKMLQIENLIAERLPPLEFRNYALSLDIDGNGNAWGFFEKLSLGICVLKIDSPYEQWYYPFLKPWRHFVPIDPSLGDLVAITRELLGNAKLNHEIGVNAAGFAAVRDVFSESVAFCYEISRGALTGAVRANF